MSNIEPADRRTTDQNIIRTYQTKIKLGPRGKSAALADCGATCPADDAPPRAREDRGNAPRLFHEIVSGICRSGRQTSRCELAASRAAAGAVQQVSP
jgi:hypothetical protein